MGSMAFWKIFVPHVLRTGAAQKIGREKVAQKRT
jgi:hypothetical protein